MLVHVAIVHGRPFNGHMHSTATSEIQTCLGHKLSYKSFVFFCFFEKSGIKEATDLAVKQLQGSTIAMISAHVPVQHGWPSAGPGPISS